MPRMPACWIEADGPPIAVMRPRLTLVEVTFMFGLPTAGESPLDITEECRYAPLTNPEE